MKIDEKTYKAMPIELQDLFYKCPNQGSDEVVGLFPDSKGQQGDVRGTEQSRTGDENTSCYGEYGRVPAAKRGDSGSAARFFYCAKASRADRNEGCEGIAKKPLNWSSGEQSPGTFQAEGTDRSAHNNHPTVKPTALMRYLCRLVTPPNGIVLDPFMGSGSTGKGAVLEGFSFIGIELDPEYFKIAEKRIASARGDEPVVDVGLKDGPSQPNLFSY
jgi:site-specific DNA-methyltransferase (adenine-specific)